MSRHPPSSGPASADPGPFGICPSRSAAGTVTRVSQAEERPDVVRPDEHPDPVAAVLEAHRTGARLALATSGTSAAHHPRRVLRTTESWWASHDHYTALTGVDARARLWVPGPLSATMNLYAAVHAAYVGAGRADHPREATHAILTPAQLDLRGAELRAGTTVVVAGAHLAQSTAHQAGRRGLRVAHYYGAAELSFVAFDADGGGLRAFPGVAIEVRDRVVWVRSRYVCDGYAGPAGSLRRDPDGWATVGDIGALDGEIVTLDGRPDAVITAGATVLIADVEAALRSAAQAPFAVHGSEHPRFGQVVTVTVTDAADRQRLDRYARTHLPPSHRPRRWQVTSTLPLTPAGKVDLGRLSTLQSALQGSRPSALPRQGPDA